MNSSKLFKFILPSRSYICGMFNFFMYGPCFASIVFRVTELMQASVRMGIFASDFVATFTFAILLRPAYHYALLSVTLYLVLYLLYSIILKSYSLCSIILQYYTHFIVYALAPDSTLGRLYCTFAHLNMQVCA